LHGISAQVEQDTTNTDENMNLDKIKNKDKNKTELKEEDEPVGDSQFSFLFSSFWWFLLDT